MSQRFLRTPNNAYLKDAIGYDSVQFSDADPVYIDSNGWLALATAGGRILGFALGGQTMSATNSTVAKVRQPYVLATPDVEMIFPSDQDATQTDVGDYADLGTVTTGAFTVDLAAGQSNEAALFVLDFDPTRTSDNDEVVVIVAQPQWSGHAAV